MTGAEMLVRILRESNIRCEITISDPKKGNYYDSNTKTVYLRKPVYAGHYAQGAAIACHEFGHLMQDVSGYWPFRISKKIGQRSHLLNAWLEWDAKKRAEYYLGFFMGGNAIKKAKSTLFKLFLTHFLPAIFTQGLYIFLIYLLYRWL